MENMDIFDFLYDEYKIKKPLRLIELFAGYGSQALALEYLHKDFESHFVCEFDKYAIQTYNEIHNTNFKTSDITKISAKDLNIVDTDKYDYMMTYSFPCQDLSLAGNQKGMSKGSGTRSGLLWEVERLLKECKELPQILVMENVPQVLSANGWHEWNYFLESLGYKNYCEVLNAKDYGIPQNRARCFMVSLLGDYNYTFPEKKKLTLRLKDMLEDKVDEKYYLSGKMIDYLNKKIEQGWKRKVLSEKNGIATCVCNPSRNQINDNYIAEKYLTDNNLESYMGTFEYSKSDNFMKGQNRFEKDKELSNVILGSGNNNGVVMKVGNYSPSGHNASSIVDKNGIAPTVMENHGTVTAITEETDKLILAGNLKGGKWDKINESSRRVYDYRGLAPTLHTCGGGNTETKVIVPFGTYYTWKDKQGNINTQCNRAANENKCALTVACAEPGKVYEGNLRIRKLTPRECFRLMGVNDREIDKITCSNAQKYKQAGNSIVVNVLMAIFKQLY